MSLILVLNSGSSSIKYELIDMTGPTTLAGGLIERIAEQTSKVSHDAGGREHVIERPLADHREGLAAMAEAFDATIPVPAGALTAVGHRVVHGGDRFSHPAVIDEAVVAAIRACVPLAPLHNPANLLGIEVAMQAYPDCPHVAVFDTAFHQTMPESSYRYAIDRAVADAHRDPPVRVPRHIPRVREQTGRGLPGHPPRAVPGDHVALGQRGVGVRGRRWPQHRHVHGPHPPGRTGHGDTLW